MSPIPVRAEYVEIDSVPLDCPAWEVTDLSDLWDIPTVTGGDHQVPYRRGVVPFRRSFGGKRVTLPFIVYGSHDPEGVPASDGRAQLWANRQELVTTVLRPRTIATVSGDRTIKYHTPAGVVIAGPGKIIGGLRPTPAGPNAFRGSIALNLSEGGLRSLVEVDETSAEVAGGATLDFPVPNPGNDYQDVLRIDMTGTATVVRLTNLTADPGGNVYLEFGGSLGSGVAINTGDFTAIRDTVSVVGLVTSEGFERWLPLDAGTNTIRIAPTGGTATVRFRHFPFYA